MAHGTERTLALHIHLFKNAGTSVEAALKTMFGEGWRSFDGSASDGVVTAPRISNLLAADPTVQAISSHQVRPPLVVGNDVQVLPIVFLRSPIDRIRSAYEFERNQGDVSPSSRIASEASFADWINFHRERGSAQVANFHVMALSSERDIASGKLFGNLAAQAHLASATKFLDALPAIGIVEEFDVSWFRIRRWLDAEFDVDFATIEKPLRLNQTQLANSSLADRISAVSEELGPQEFDRLKEANALDQLLYDWALARERIQSRAEL